MSYAIAPPLLVLVLLLIALVVPSALRRHRPNRPKPTSENQVAVGIGTVRTVAERITVEVESVSGQTFVGRLQQADDDVAARLRPGVVLLVSFDPDAREQLTLADDVLAVRAGTVAPEDLIRHGTKSSGVVTAVRPGHEDYRKVELDVIVRKPEGGQFPARETALLPATALDAVKPGSVVDAYYRHGDERAVAVCVPPC